MKWLNRDFGTVSGAGQFLAECDDALRGFEAFVDFGDQRHADAVRGRD